MTPLKRSRKPSPKRPLPARRPFVTTPTTLASWEDAGLTPLAVQQALAAVPAIKLAVRTSGWYYVTQPALAAAGLSHGIDPRRIQLFVQGQQQPIIVTGETDGRFDPQDGLEFYGERLETPWTDTRYYWLVVGTRPGLRGRKQLSESAPPTRLSFPATVTHQDRTVYVPAIRNGDASNFFGAVITAEPVEQFLHLRHLAPTAAANAELEITLHGVTEALHRVAVKLNGQSAGVLTFAGLAPAVSTFAISQTWLQEGINQVTLQAQGGEVDVSVVGRIRMTYWRTYHAEADTLRVTAPGQHQLTLVGFQQPGIRVVDVTEPQAVSELTGEVVTHDTGYAITVTASQPGPRTLLAFTDDQRSPPAALVANQPSQWHRADQEADLVILSHAAFLEAVAPLRALREAQGWRVVVIDVQELYDEYRFGHKHPDALRTFLQDATRHWKLPPRFVLMVGDASFDPRDYLGFGETDLVPTQWVNTAMLETASDDALADFNHDGVPELAVGRLPVRTVAEAHTVVAKLIAYAEAEGAWTQDALLVADESVGFDFATITDTVGAYLPQTMRVDTLRLGQTEIAIARDTLLTRLNAGQLLVNYFGHGSTAVWSGNNLLTADDAWGLSNGQRLPVVVAMTCLNGFFHDLFTGSLAETLLLAPHGGSVAVWTSSGLTSPPAQVIMNQEFIAGLFGAERRTVGEAIMQAKAAIADRDVRRTWIYFGDPTIWLKR